MNLNLNGSLGFKMFCNIDWQFRDKYMNVFLYVLNTLSDWEIGYLTAEINSGRYFKSSKNNVNLIKVGNTYECITTMGGIKITPDEDICNLKAEKGDVIILPGGNTWFEKCNENIIHLIPDMLDRDILVAAICGATVALANYGILNNTKHTSNDLSYLQTSCPGYTGESFYIDTPSVVDNNLITATGLAPLEFSYEVFKKIDVMHLDTLQAWYQLYKTRDLKYYSSLVGSLK